MSMTQTMLCGTPSTPSLMSGVKGQSGKTVIHAGAVLTRIALQVDVL